jgi:mannose-6-phosphate isomerase-like protein (cupin superfamily)
MLRRRSELERIEFGGLGIYDYTADRSAGASLAAIDVPAGAAHAWSWSQRSDKYYLVTAGRIRFHVEDQNEVLNTGDFWLIEKGQRFRYVNEWSDPASLVLVHEPSFDLDSEVFES